MSVGLKQKLKWRQTNSTKKKASSVHIATTITKIISMMKNRISIYLEIKKQLCKVKLEFVAEVYRRKSRCCLIERQMRRLIQHKVNNEIFEDVLLLPT